MVVILSRKKSANSSAKFSGSLSGSGHSDLHPVKWFTSLYSFLESFPQLATRSEMQSLLAKYIVLCNLCLSALRASQVDSDLYFLKTCSLFLTTCFCFVIPSLNQALGGCWVTTFVLSGAMASNVDFKLPENLDTSSSKSSMLRRE